MTGSELGGMTLTFTVTGWPTGSPGCITGSIKPGGGGPPKNSTIQTWNICHSADIINIADTNNVVSLYGY